MSFSPERMKSKKSTPKYLQVWQMLTHVVDSVVPTGHRQEQIIRA
jgi:hypothetical protein